MRWSLRKGRLDGLGGRLEWDLSPLARSILEAASSVVGKRGSQNGDIRVSDQVTDPLRHAGPRPLAEKRRPLAAAVGATRAVRVIVMLVAQVLAVVDLGKLAQGFEQVRDLHRADRATRLIENQQQPCPMGQVSFRVMPQSVVADPMEASWQDVLQESPKELDTGQSHGPPGVGAAVLEAERHVGLVHCQDPRIADGRAEHIPRQVVQHGVVAVTVVFHERDPLAPPNAGRDACKHAGLLFLHGITELRGDLSGQDADRHEELAPGWLPMFAVGGDSAAGDQHLNMGVIPELGVACMQHRAEDRLAMVHSGACRSPWIVCSNARAASE